MTTQRAHTQCDQCHRWIAPSEVMHQTCEHPHLCPNCWNEMTGPFTVTKHANGLIGGTVRR